jgi:hypothetical protein
VRARVTLYREIHHKMGGGFGFVLIDGLVSVFRRIDCLWGGRLRLASTATSDLMEKKATVLYCISDQWAKMAIR